MIACRAGHPRTEANTYIYPDPKLGDRPFCRPCKARNSRKYRTHQIEAPRDRRAYREATRDKHKVTADAWYAANRERCAAIRRIRRIALKVDPSEGELAQAWELRKKYPKKEVRR